MNHFHFFNHASFAIERDSEILLIDPWYEGTAFHNGWALLDGNTSNSSAIEWLRQSKKQIFIWYSHEHSDHLSISFIKSIQKEKLDLAIIFQKTLDGRVRKFLRSQHLKVIDAHEGRPIRLGDNLTITTWPYIGGDSFCLIKSNKTTLLNINDCVISTEQQAQIVRDKYLPHSTNIDILLTQFGYANWIGNEEDHDERSKAASEQLNRIYSQDKIFCPSAIIPFASFVYFCHPDNFYLNDKQNSPTDVISASRLELIRDRIFFLKPRDSLSVDRTESIPEQLATLSGRAIAHWDKLRQGLSPTPSESKETGLQELVDVFLNYRRRMTLNFAFLPQILESLLFIAPINILITDVNKVAVVSYIKGITFTNTLCDWDISLSTEVFMFVFRNEFGFNTTNVNGRFRLGKDRHMTNVYRFFSVQDFYRGGFGLMHPIVSAKFVLGAAARFTKRRFFTSC
jgi:hypothetical protein